jgi:Spy/CpxP family protein refolding chaperone
MDIFSQKRFLQRLVVLLIISNLLIAGFYWWRFNGYGQNKGKDPRPITQQELPSFLQKELGLNNTQASALKEIRASFFKKERVLSDSIRQLRDSMNQLMFGSTIHDPELEALGKAVSAYEYKMELLRIAQAREVRSLCTPEQQVRLEKLIREIRDYLKPESGKK